MQIVKLEELDRQGQLRLVESSSSRTAKPHQPSSSEQLEFRDSLDEIARQGAQAMLRAALEAEANAYLERFADERDANGRRLVVRNGQARSREIVTGVGPLEIAAPRINDKRVIDGERQKFSSWILPAYMRKSPKVAEVLPVLYLRGLSTNDFRPALASLVGENASGLSSSSITRLLSTWEDEHKTWCKRDLSAQTYVYVWADGVHLNVRLEEERLCLLVLIGVTPEGKKELLAVEDGYRESKDSWASVLRTLRDRGLKAPKLAVGDGALGFWAAVRDVWPTIREQRCWFHKMGNVLDKLPKQRQPKAKQMLRDIVGADSKAEAEKLMKAFAADFQKKYPRAVECLLKDQRELLTLFDFPAEHWLHLRTTNVIESAFATLRLRQRTTKGPGSRARGISMAFKLLAMSELRWRRLNGAQLLPLVRDGVCFMDGEQQKSATTNKKDSAA